MADAPYRRLPFQMGDPNVRFLSWLRDLTPAVARPRAGRTPRRSSRRETPTPRLRVEALEGRCCPAGYAITDLGTLGGAASWANAINTAGQVVGNAQTAGGLYHPFRYSGGV